MDRSDRVDYQFYGFLPKNERDEHDIFLQYYNHRYQAILNSDDDDLKNIAVPLKEYLTEINSLKEKKNHLLNAINNPLKLENSPEYEEFWKQQQQKEQDQGYDNFEIEQTLQEYVEKDNIVKKINKQVSEQNILKKIQSQKEIKNLQKIALKKAWRQLYYTPDILQAKQCFIQVQLLDNYLLWLYFALHEVQQSQEVNECTVVMNGLNLQDYHIEKIYAFVFQVINQCDNLQIYKLLLNNNKLSKINNLLLLFPRNVTHLTIELQNNQIEDNSFLQLYIPDNIQIFTLDISNNQTLSTKALKHLGNNIHINLELELFISENINQYDVLIDYIGKCHSLKINDKQVIYNDSFMLEVQIENITADQFLHFVTVIMRNINFEQQVSANANEKTFSFTSREVREKKNDSTRSGQLINLVEDNKDRCNQIGSHHQLSSSQTQINKNKSLMEIDTQKKSQQNEEVSEKDKPHSQSKEEDAQEDEEDDDDDDVDIIEKKDFVLSVNGVKILDTQEDGQLTLNLSQFEMSIFEDRNLFNWISSLPKIPTILQVKSVDDFGDKDKVFSQLILSRKENSITINDKTFEMKSFSIDFSPFVDTEHDLTFLFSNLSLNSIIEELEIKVYNSDSSTFVIKKIIELYDTQQFSKLKKLKIVTDVEEQSFSPANINRKYQIVYDRQLFFRQQSYSFDSNSTDLFQLGRTKSTSINHLSRLHSETKKKKQSLEL